MKRVQAKQWTQIGRHIDSVTAEYCKLSKRAKVLIDFDFNGVKLTASPKTSPATLRWAFDNELERKAAAYRNSPEGRAAAQDRNDELIVKQVTIEHLIANMDFSTHDKTMTWLRQFAEVADDVGVSYDKAPIIFNLTIAGYKENDECGRPKEDYSNREIMAKWIAGQALNCLNMGMPPHPITEKFVGEYFAIPA